MEVFDHGAAGTQIKKFEMNGMNDDMAKAILERADFELTKLGLPLEIHLTSSWGAPMSFGSRPAQALIVVDEAGTLRHSRGWPEFGEGPPSEGFGAGASDSRAPNAGFYSSAEKLWAAIRNDKVPGAKHGGK